MSSVGGKNVTSRRQGPEKLASRIRRPVPLLLMGAVGLLGSSLGDAAVLHQWWLVAKIVFTAVFVIVAFWLTWFY